MRAKVFYLLPKQVCILLKECFMSALEKVIEVFKNSKDPLNAGKVVELSGLEKKEVDKAMAQLKKEEKIISPKRCYWTLK